MASPWTYWAGDLRTGQLFTELPVMSDSWGTELNVAGPLSVALNLGDPDVQFVKPALALEPARTFLAVSRGNRFFNAGPVWMHDYSPTTQDRR